MSPGGGHIMTNSGPLLKWKSMPAVSSMALVRLMDEAQANSGFSILAVSAGLENEAELIREFAKSDIAADAFHFPGHWTAVVIDHVKYNFYSSDSFWDDGGAQKRLVKAWTLISQNYHDVLWFEASSTSSSTPASLPCWSST